MAIALRAGFGQDEVSHGTKRYRVGADDMVIVPPMVAVYLIRNAGFHAVSTPGADAAPAPASGVSPQSLVRVRHPTAAACSYGGCEYRRDQNADFLVPATAVADLIGHGFIPVEAADRSRNTASPVAVSPADGPQKAQESAKHDNPRGPIL